MIIIMIILIIVIIIIIMIVPTLCMSTLAARLRAERADREVHGPLRDQRRPVGHRQPAGELR